MLEELEALMSEEEGIHDLTDEEALRAISKVEG